MFDAEIKAEFSINSLSNKYRKLFTQVSYKIARSAYLRIRSCFLTTHSQYRVRNSRAHFSNIKARTLPKHAVSLSKHVGAWSEIKVVWLGRNEEAVIALKVGLRVASSHIEFEVVQYVREVDEEGGTRQSLT